MPQTFKSIEEYVKYRHDLHDRALPKSGIYCNCSCYKMDEDIRGKNPMNECTLLLPQELYEKLESYTREEDKRFYSKASVAVIFPGIIRVKLEPKVNKEKYGDDKPHYINRWQELCEYSTTIDYLMGKHLGQKIRLGKNLSVK